ncbi:MAG: mechanosensitive ion channel family protein [Bacteroidales bacterium]|nr:mechanosensitive ion channel family protein [Bacteroidales bacterium]
MTERKTFKSALTSVLSTVAAAVVMIVFQTISNNSAEDRLAGRLLSEIPAQLDSETEKRLATIREYDASFQRDLAAIRTLFETGGTDKVIERFRAESAGTEIYVTGRDGIITNGTPEGCTGKKLTELEPLSPDEYRLLVEGDGDTCTAIRKSGDGSAYKIFATDYGRQRLVMPASLKGNYASIYSLDNLSGLFGFVDERMVIVPIDNTEGSVISLKIEEGDLSGKSIGELGIDESAIHTPSSGHADAFGLRFRYRTIQYKSEVLGDLTILAACSDEGAVPTGPLLILLVTILTVTFLLQLYSLYIDEEPGKLQIRVSGLLRFGRKKRLSLDAEKARILLPFSLVCIVIVTAAGFYINTLNMVGNQIWTSRWNIAEVSGSLSRIDKTTVDNLNAQTEDADVFLKIAASVLEERQGSLLDCRDAARLKTVRDESGAERTVEICNPWLGELARVEPSASFSVFDSEGKLLSTSGTRRNLRLSRDNPADACVFDVIDGVRPVCEFFNEESLMIAAPFTLRRGSDMSDAILVYSLDKQVLENNSTLQSIRNTFDSASETGQSLYIMTTATEDRRTIYVSEALKQDVKSIPAAAYTDGYAGFHKMHGRRYFLATRLTSGARNDYYIMSFSPVSEVYAGRAASTATTFAVTLLTMLVLLAILLVYGPERTEKLEALSRQELEARQNAPDAGLAKPDMEAGRRPSPSQRILKSIRFIWFILLFAMTLVLVRGSVSGPADSLSGYLVSFAWQRGVNIFSITTMLIVIMSFSFLLFVLTKLMSVLGSALNAGTETVCQLLVSLLRYTGYIVAAFITLFMFGVDTTGVLASLGAFSVMVGMGARSLITDILAGISIILEKDYRVGDIVEINGFCGKVTEIGIRTTKVEDIDGNVKIFYNSAVNGVVNMTSKPSAVRLDVKLDPSHGFQQVEEEFNLFFDDIESKYPQIKGKCLYLGVQESSPGFNLFRITVPCDEIDRAPLRRILIKDLSEFCKMRGIKKL